jgi:hypothetical protein
MVTMQRIAVAFGFVMGLIAAPVTLWAAEHGGTTVGVSKEHGVAAVGAGKEHGGATPATDEASLLREAAAALRKGESRPDLAVKLEQLADEEAKEKK